MPDRFGSPAPELLDALIASLADGVFVIDAAGLVRFVNPAGSAMLGYEPGALLGVPSHETLHAHRRDGSVYPPEECPLLLPRTTGQRIHADDEWFIRADGSMLPVSCSSAPVEMAEGRGAVVVFRDATAARDAEAGRRAAEAGRIRAEEAEASRARIVAAADDERRRLGRALHDGAQQRLLGVVMALGQAGRELPPTEPGRAAVGQALEQTQLAIDDLRDFAAGLHPAILTNRGLTAAVSSLTAPVPFPVRCDVAPGRFPAPVEMAAYFVIAEALANVVKHADATEAEVVAEVVGGSLRVRVIDDGRGGAGFAAAGRAGATASVSSGGGTGLQGLADRVAALGGTLAVDSPPGGGTRVAAEFPLA